MSDKKDRNIVESELKQARLVYLLGEAVEKISRVRRILNRQRIYVEIEHRQFEYSNPIKTLAGAIDKFEQEGLISNSERFLSLLRNESLSDRQMNVLLGQIHQVLRGVQGIHELLLLLPREAVIPQVFFLLEDCFTRAPEATIILTNLICSYEFRVEDVLQKLDLTQRELPYLRNVLKDFPPGGSLLGLAFIDRDNPLAWPVLTHEYAHSLDDAQRISKQIIHGDQAPAEDKEDADRVNVRWAAEVFCDLVATHVLGPVSLVPILFVEMTQAQISMQWQHHPPTPVRLRLVRDYLHKLGVSAIDFDFFFDMYEFDYEEKVRVLGAEERSNEAEMRTGAEKFLASISDTIAVKVRAQELRPFTNERLETARKLQEALSSGSPISSVRYDSDESIFARLNSVGYGAQVEDVYAVLSSLDETPTHAAEILTAGWLYKLASFQQKLQHSFEKLGSQPQSELTSYAEYLEQSDRLLLKSLELATIQGALRSSS